MLGCRKSKAPLRKPRRGNRAQARLAREVLIAMASGSRPITPLATVLDSVMNSANGIHGEVALLRLQV